MISAAGDRSPSERQLRIIGMISGIEDAGLLSRIERMIDLHRSGLRAIDEAEMQAILDDLRPEDDRRLEDDA